jgi:hypothetical protein
MRLIFTLAGEDDDICVARYLETILTKLKCKAGVIDSHDEMYGHLKFEEILFLRIAYEYVKMYKADRSLEFNDYLDKIAISFEEYSEIFNYLLTYTDYDSENDQEVPNRLIFAEWVKFSLTLPIEDEVTRRNLVSLMFELVGRVENSLRDYQYLLKYKRFLIRD